MSLLAKCYICSSAVDRKKESTNIFTPKFGHLYDYLFSIVKKTHGEYRLCNKKCLILVKKLYAGHKATIDHQYMLEEFKTLVASNDLSQRSPKSPAKSFVRAGLKRTLIKTPTPKKLIKKKKTPTASTGKATTSRPTSKKFLDFEDTKSFEDKWTQTRKDTEKEFTYKIVSQRNGKKTTRIVNEDTIQKICQAVIHGDDLPNKFARILIADEVYRPSIENKFVNILGKQAQSLSSEETDSILKKRQAEDLLSSRFPDILNEWKSSGPLFRVLEAIAVANKGRGIDEAHLHEAVLTFAGSVLLYHRNHNMCRIQFALGLILDAGGATDEVISLFHNFGICVGTTSLHSKRKECVKVHNELTDHLFRTPKLSTEIQSSARLIKATTNSFRPVQALPKSICAVRQNVIECALECDSIEFQNVVLPSVKSHSAYSSRLDSDTIMSSLPKPIMTAKLAESNAGHDELCYNKKLKDSFQQEGFRVPEVNLLIQNPEHCAQSMATMEKTQVYVEKDILDTAGFDGPPPFDVFGDNFDITVSPGNMTKENQRKSLHWFLVVAARKRIIGSHLPHDQPKADVEQMDTTCWLPSMTEINSLEENFDFHIARTLQRFIKCCETIPFQTYIDHPYIAQSKMKSAVIDSQLIEESENSSEGMIKISKKVHEEFVPVVAKEIAEQVVFDGDCLTNERAFTAHQQVINGKNGEDRLDGLINRPGGLHRAMNFTQLIYQLLYKESTSQGTLYQLRNAVHRRDVSGTKEDVIKKFRSHQKFLDDVLDAYIVATALQHFNMKTMDDEPQTNQPPEHDKSQWLLEQACAIRKTLTYSSANHAAQMQSTMEEENEADRAIKEHMGKDGLYHCKKCKKTFKTAGGLVRHCKNKHDVILTTKPKTKCSVECNPSVPVLINMTLLLRDTWDAYNMCDGDRVFRNCKFEFLYLFGHGHIKYRLWLWRMLTYEMATLTPRQAFEYKWNIAVNVNGGIGCNMPNDNFVETQVKAIKQAVARQGPNKTFSSAQMVCKTTQVVSQIKAEYMSVSETHRAGRKRPEFDKTSEIEEMVKDICNAGLSVDISKILDGFEHFKDPLVSLDKLELHKWIKNQQKIACTYMMTNKKRST